MATTARPPDSGSALRTKTGAAGAAVAASENVSAPWCALSARIRSFHAASASRCSLHLAWRWKFARRKITCAFAVDGFAPRALARRAEQANYEATTRMPEPRFLLQGYWIRRRTYGAPVLLVLPKAASTTRHDVHREVVAGGVLRQGLTAHLEGFDDFVRGDRRCCSRSWLAAAAVFGGLRRIFS